jgi:hypothetical protein
MKSKDLGQIAIQLLPTRRDNDFLLRTHWPADENFSVLQFGFVDSLDRPAVTVPIFSIFSSKAVFDNFP